MLYQPEKNSQNVLKNPGPILVPEDRPDCGDGYGAGQQDELTKLQVGDADVHVATRQTESGTSSENKILL
jgi:hypothetical protein